MAGELEHDGGKQVNKGGETIVTSGTQVGEVRNRQVKFVFETVLRI